MFRHGDLYGANPGIAPLKPFFGLTMFLSMTSHYTEVQRRKLALSVTGGVIILTRDMTLDVPKPNF